MTPDRELGWAQTRCLGWVRVKFIGWKRKFTNNVFLMIEFAVAWEAQVLPLNCPFY